MASSAKPVVWFARQEGGGWPRKGSMKEKPVRVKPEAMRIRPMMVPDVGVWGTVKSFMALLATMPP